MNECVFERLTFTNHNVFCNLSYPQIEGKTVMNAFYASLAENLRAFGENSGAERLIMKMTCAVRFRDERSIYITFDLLISRAGEVKYYARHAQGWNTEKERLLRLGGRGDVFFDGEKYVKITNLFGKIQGGRMSDYIVESEIFRRRK